MTGMWPFRRLAFGLIVLAATLTACASPVRSTAGLSAANGTDLAVTLVVNGQGVATIPAHAGTVSMTADRLPALPWAVEARSPSGRLLTSMTVKDGDVQAYGNSSKGAATRVDLSCGRLDIWSGPPLLGPGPGPGLPGDCAP
jgi:hypothetical protein